MTEEDQTSTGSEQVATLDDVLDELRQIKKKAGTIATASSVIAVLVVLGVIVATCSAL